MTNKTDIKSLECKNNEQLNFSNQLIDTFPNEIEDA